PICTLDHLVDGSHCQLILDLRHDLRPALFPRQEFSQLFDVSFFAHETQPDKISAHFNANGNVGQVLSCERREIHAGARQINVTSRTEYRGCQNLATHAIFSLVEHEQFDKAIITKNGFTQHK